MKSVEFKLYLIFKQVRSDYLRTNLVLFSQYVCLYIFSFLSLACLNGIGFCCLVLLIDNVCMQGVSNIRIA